MAIEWSALDETGYTRASCMGGAVELGVIRLFDRSGWRWWISDRDINTLACADDDVPSATIEAAKAAAIAAARGLLRDALAELGGGEG